MCISAFTVYHEQPDYIYMSSVSDGPPNTSEQHYSPDLIGQETPGHCLSPETQYMRRLVFLCLFDNSLKAKLLWILQPLDSLST